MVGVWFTMVTVQEIARHGCNMVYLYCLALTLIGDD